MSLERESLAPARAALKRTALNGLHKSLGAKMVEFGGWEMPVEYSGIIQEHLAVRRAAGLFDVSHMGEIEISGPRALSLLQHITSNDASRLKDFQAQYSALMHPKGSAVDDCVVHRLTQEQYLICVNAANTEKDFDWMVEHNSAGAEVRNVSSEYSQLALQGPRAAEIVSKVSSVNIPGLKYYWFCHTRLCGVEGLLARTGYTGEDGFEFYFAPGDSERVWSTLIEAGKAEGLVPAGLGARNTLRLEAGYPLYGHELDEETTLLEANLGWITKLDKGEFLGRDALLQQRARGTRKKLVGFEMTGQGIARDGYELYAASENAGRVTSGSYAPFLKKNIGMAYTSSPLASVGSEVEIEIRGRRARARIVPLPFYKKPKIG
jgi:aminomethyltransferase